jgi:hypothetical protein
MDKPAQTPNAAANSIKTLSLIIHPAIKQAIASTAKVPKNLKAVAEGFILVIVVALNVLSFLLSRHIISGRIFSKSSYS